MYSVETPNVFEIAKSKLIKDLLINPETIDFVKWYLQDNRFIYETRKTDAFEMLYHFKEWYETREIQL